MQRCGQCGHNNPDESIFCGQCSHRLNSRCVQCGYDNLVTQKFCGNCGRQLRDDEELPASARRYGQASPAASPPPDAGFSTAPPPNPYPIEGTPAATSAAIPEYALLSLEFANWEQALAHVPDPLTMDQERARHIMDLSRWTQEQGGQIGHSRHGVLFATFPFAGDLAESVQQALHIALPRLEEEFRFGNTLLKLKGGLDIERAQARNPLTSSLERSLAQAGTLVISEAAYLPVRDAYPADPLGPVSVGGRTVRLFRLPAMVYTPPEPEPEITIPAAEPEPNELSQQDLQAIWEEAHGPVAPPPPAQPVAIHLLPSTPAEPDWPVPNANEGEEPPLDEAESAPLPNTIAIGEAISPPAATTMIPMPPPTEAPYTFPAEIERLPAPPPESGPSENPYESVAAENIASPAEPDVLVCPETQAALSTLFPDKPSTEFFPETSVSNRPSRQEDRHRSGLTAPDSTQQSSGDDWPFTYEPPILGGTQPVRSPNLRYGQTIEVLSAELDAFLNETEDTANRRRVLALCASDGLGKSNIIGLTRSAIDPERQRAIWLGGSAERPADGRHELPLFCWQDVFYNLLALAPEGQPRRDAQERIAHFLDHVFDGQATEADRALLAAFLSVERPQPLSLDLVTQRDRLHHFLLRLLVRLSGKRPIILALEDIMFADAASLELLAFLLAETPDHAAIGFILTHTREFQPQGALTEALLKTACKELVTADLNDGEMEQFLNSGPLGGNLQEFPASLINALYRQSGGLSLWLEEALRLLHLRGVITVDPDTHQFRLQKDFPPGDATLPDTLDELLRERLRGLSDTTLYVLRLATVLGEKFPVNLLSALAQMEPEEFGQTLDILGNQGYLLLEGAHAARFRHGRLRETVYRDIEPDLRIQMHQLVSAALENDFNQGLTVNPLLIAHHSQAGRLPNRALNYWHLAGANAAQLGALTAMNVALFRVLDLLRVTPNPELALRTLENLGAFNLDDHPGQAAEWLAWAASRRERQGDENSLMEVLGLLAAAYERQGDFVRTLETLDKALDWVDAGMYPGERAALHIKRMECLYVLGRLQQARELMETTIGPLLAQAQPAGKAALLEARLLKARILLAQCDPNALPLLEETLNAARTEALTAISLASQLLLTHARLLNGRYEECNREGERLLGEIEALRASEQPDADADWFLAQWGLLAIRYHIEMEDWDSASQLVLTVIANAETVKDYHTRSLAEVYAGYATGRSGRAQEGRQLLEQAIERAAEHRFASVALLGWRLLAEFELSQGNVVVADALVTRALPIANKPDIGNTDESIRLALLQARVLLLQGDVRQAGRVLEPLWPEVAKAARPPLIAACAAEIGQLYLCLAEGATTPGNREKHRARGQDFLRKARDTWRTLGHALQTRRLDALLRESAPSNNPAGLSSVGASS
jgi:hypothetical protein